MITRVIATPANLKSLSFAIWDCDSSLVRLVLTINSLVWATLLLLPGSTFERLPYVNMAAIMSETAWSFAFLFLAVLQLGDLFLANKFEAFTILLSTVVALFYTTVTMLILLALHPPTAALAGQIALAIGAIWISVRPYFLKKAINGNQSQGDLL